MPLSYRREGKRYDIYVRLTGAHREGELEKLIEAKPTIIPLPPKKPDGEGKKPGGRKEHEASQGPSPSPRPPTCAHARGGEETVPAQARIRQLLLQQLERTRVWDAWTARGSFAGQDGPWSLAGPLPGGACRFVLGNDGCLLELPNEEIKWTAGNQLEASLLPQGSGGLLPTLYLWRRLAVLGPGKFGEVSYVGKAPLPGHEELLDVLLGIYGEVECRDHFDPAQGNAGGHGDVSRQRGRSLRGLFLRLPRVRRPAHALADGGPLR